MASLSTLTSLAKPRPTSFQLNWIPQLQDALSLDCDHHEQTLKSRVLVFVVCIICLCGWTLA